ncbi:MAG: hypothetical protein C0483_22545 [Pirellula sp.]|nr:hypothetical protein [Pirellula sp.]
MAVTLVTNALVLLALMSGLWIVATRLRDVSIVDCCWGAAFVVVAWVSTTLNRPASSRILLLAGLTTLWGMRLSLYLLWRKRGHAEDRRYQAMRDYHGPRFWWVSLITVFLLQGMLVWFVALPLQFAAVIANPAPLGWLDAGGTALALIGLAFEAGGDWQLARFQADPANKGRVLDEGFWRYTRHPNYFGDFCVWWGLYAVAAAGGAWGTILSPVVMTVLLLKISGVALLEKSIGERRPQYAKYVRQTNAFFPGPPRDDA